MDRPGRGPQDRGWGSEWPGVSSTQIKRSDNKADTNATRQPGRAELRNAGLQYVVAVNRFVVQRCTPRQADGETVNEQAKQNKAAKEP